MIDFLLGMAGPGPAFALAVVLILTHTAGRARQLP